MIRAYDFDNMQSIIASKMNPCEHENGGCQHLCLLTNGTQGYSCACNLGYQLNADAFSCRWVGDEFLMYAKGNYIRGRIIDPLG